MKRILDLVYGIPYYTNSSDQQFAWYVIYNDSVIILENNKFSSVNFKNIPKTNIRYLGLYGCNIHLACDFQNKVLSFYNTYNNNESLYRCKYTLENSVRSNILKPVQFKGFIYEPDLYDMSKDKFFIKSFYVGWNEDVVVNGYKFTNKIYFSIDLENHPDSIGLIYKLVKNDSSLIYPSNFNYRLLISDNNSTIINDIQRNQENTREINLNQSLLYKTIFRFK